MNYAPVGLSTLTATERQTSISPFPSLARVLLLGLPNFLSFWTPSKRARLRDTPWTHSK